MKRLLLTLLVGAMASVALLAGCARVVDLEPPVTRNFNITGFTGVEYTGLDVVGSWFQFGDLSNRPFGIEVAQGETFGVDITTNENLFDYIDVSKVGDTLKIVIDRSKIRTDKATITARVTMPALRSITLVGGTDGMVRGFTSTTDFDARVSSGSILDADVQAGNTAFRVSSSSRLVARGTAREFSADVSSGSTLEIQMQTGDADLDVQSSSRVTGTLKAEDTRVSLSSGSRLDMDMETADADFTVQSSSRGSGTLKSDRTSVSLSSGSTIEMDVQTGDASFIVQSSSRVLGNLQATGTAATLSSGSQFEVEGSGGDAILSASSSSRLVIPGFSVNDASVKLSTGSHADVTVGGRLDVDISSSSRLTYGGNPTLGIVQVSSGANLTRR